MSTPQNQFLEHIQKRVNAFDTTGKCVPGPPDGRRFFVDSEQENMARQLGEIFWLPLERTYKIFLYTYAALFAIPTFTTEATRRHPPRFSHKRLPLTIRSTSGFILDAFGYDRRTERPRDILYWPAPTIQSVHAATENKQRISSPSMAYFAWQLIRAAETLSSERNRPDFAHLQAQHYNYVGDFFRTAGYPFPHNPEIAKKFALDVDHHLAGNTCAEYWHNLPHAAKELGVNLNLQQLEQFLPPESARHFTNALTNS